MIALDAALRRLTVCQLTRESRGNGGGLRPRVWLRLRAAAGSNWTPDGILQLEGEANFSLFGAEAHPKTTLYGVVFQKIEWAPASRALRPPRTGGCRAGVEALVTDPAGHAGSRLASSSISLDSSSTR